MSYEPIPDEELPITMPTVYAHNRFAAMDRRVELERKRALLMRDGATLAEVPFEIHAEIWALRECSYIEAFGESYPPERVAVAEKLYSMITYDTYHLPFDTDEYKALVAEVCSFVGFTPATIEAASR
jgi:uncharacterized protein YxjI